LNVRLESRPNEARKFRRGKEIRMIVRFVAIFACVVNLICLTTIAARSLRLFSREKLGLRLEACPTDVRKFCKREKVEVIACYAANFVVETELDLLDSDITTGFVLFFLGEVEMAS
jgi:hypothetical protein